MAASHERIAAMPSIKTRGWSSQPPALGQLPRFASAAASKASQMSGVMIASGQEVILR
jgi:hypothetical protein